MTHYYDVSKVPTTGGPNTREHQRFPMKKFGVFSALAAGLWAIVNSISPCDGLAGIRVDIKCS